MRPRLETNVTIERDFHDRYKYRVTICPGNDYCKVSIETTYYLMKKSNLPCNMKRGTIQKHYFHDIAEFLKTLATSKLTLEIVTAILHKVLLLLNLN
jgi:hypothetical protein